MQQIYLDNNATTAMTPAVTEALHNAFCVHYANPASQHQSGQRARRVLTDTCQRITSLLGGETAGRTPDRLVLTSGGTESNNLALRGFVRDVPGANIVISAIEHPSISETARDLQRRGIQVRQLGVTRDGVVQVDKLQSLLDARTCLVSVMLGNHETGVVQPVQAIAAVARQHGVPVHCDAVQAVGKVAVDFRTLGVDALSFSAHKFHGPVGIGGLLLRHETTLAPLITGGFQQQGIRSGTQPCALALGMLAALETAVAEDTGERRMRDLRDRFEHRLTELVPTLIINGGAAERLPHTSNLSFPGLNRQALVMALDLAGVACSTGSACASGSSEPSPVLIAMGLPQPLVEGAVRFSLSRLTTASEVDQAVDRITRVHKTLQRD